MALHLPFCAPSLFPNGRARCAATSSSPAPEREAWITVPPGTISFPLVWAFPPPLVFRVPLAFPAPWLLLWVRPLLELPLRAPWLSPRPLVCFRPFSFHRLQKVQKKCKRRLAVDRLKEARRKLRPTHAGRSFLCRLDLYRIRTHDVPHPCK